ncbi:hypothetical protein [Rhizobium sp.]|uniref:hypothetical protein n=1 Tax=Rhizobium sp. TaxID=391 RepID=UPI0028A84329
MVDYGIQKRKGAVRLRPIGLGIHLHGLAYLSDALILRHAGLDPASSQPKSLG